MPRGMMLREAVAPWVRSTLPIVPLLAELSGGTINLAKLWSNAANVVPLSPASAATRSMVSSISKGFLTILKVTASVSDERERRHRIVYPRN